MYVCEERCSKGSLCRRYKNADTRLLDPVVYSHEGSITWWQECLLALWSGVNYLISVPHFYYL